MHTQGLPRFVRRRALLFGCLAAASGVAGAAADPAGFAVNLAGVALTDQAGRGFDFAGLLGRVVLVNFVFTGCSTVCPVQTRALAEVRRALAAPVRERVHFVSVSLDPLNDTPAALAAYARRFDVDTARWSFVTGRPGDIDRLAQRLRLFPADPLARRPQDHATSLWLVDARGRLVQRYAGNPPEAARLVRELTALQAMAG